MKKIITIVVLIVLFAAGHFFASKTNQSDQPASDEKIYLAGVSLGDSADTVKKILGDNYSCESMPEDWYSQKTSRWSYGDKIEVIIGEETDTVLTIGVYDESFTTTNGERTGLKAKEVLQAYQDKYQLVRDHFEGREIPGWFVVEEGVWLIFNFKDDGTLVNQTIDPEDTVESIHLVYEKFVH
jgi:hypothetical protein